MWNILKKEKKNRGMTYVELIVVLSIFSAMTSVVLFNYGDFQSKVEIKNLASDIALKVVEAQRSSLGGLLPTQTTGSTWKPAYGLYFNLTGDNKSFIYFTDINNSNWYDDVSCSLTLPLSGECLDKITISKGNYLARIDSYVGSTPTQITNPIAITYKRPNSGATFSYSNGTPLTGFDYIQITVNSPKVVTCTSGSACAKINIYPSGRIEIN